MSVFTTFDKECIRVIFSCYVNINSFRDNNVNEMNIRISNFDLLKNCLKNNYFTNIINLINLTNNDKKYIPSDIKIINSLNMIILNCINMMKEFDKSDKFYGNIYNKYDKNISHYIEIFNILHDNNDYMHFVYSWSNMELIKRILNGDNMDLFDLVIEKIKFINMEKGNMIDKSGDKKGVNDAYDILNNVKNIKSLIHVIEKLELDNKSYVFVLYILRNKYMNDEGKKELYEYILNIYNFDEYNFFSSIDINI